MTNLFRAFDPSSILGLSLNWLSSSLILIFLPSIYFIQTSRRLAFWKKLSSVLHVEFSRVLGIAIKPGVTWVVVSLFVFIFLNNRLGLFPYIFTSSRHITFAVSLALPLWAGHVFWSWFKQPQFALAHLVPTGTPGALIAFIVLIELTRNLIRPLTLRVRLIANLTAGHLLLCLISSNLSVKVFGPRFVLVVSGLVILVVLEIAVSLIQAYVFTLLMRLYLEEVQTSQVSR